jgi:lathosterol oxidase
MMEAKTFIEVWPNIILFDLLRYLIPASIAFVLFWVIGRNWWRHRFIQANFPKSKQLWKEFAYSMSTVIIFSLVGFLIYSAENSGLTRIYDNFNEFGTVYLIASLLITIVFHDFYFYWTHRLMHHKKLFKYIHRVHHESTNPSPWAAYSFHPWEALIQAMVLPILVFTLPLHPLVIFIFLTYMIVRNVIGHLGFEILPTGFTKNKWVSWNTAITHHNMHHEHFHVNYGLYFSWWDRLMNTEHKKYHETFEEVTSRPKSCALKPSAKKSVAAPVIIVLSFSTTLAQSVSVSGKWVTYNEQTGSPLSIIEIKETKTSIEGKIVKIFLEPYQGEDPVCTKCPGERKNKKVIDMNFLWGFKQDGDSWSSGSILDPESGEIYAGKLWLYDENTLHVRGYTGPFDVFHRTQTWKRNGVSNAISPAGIWQTIDDHWNKVKSIVEIKNVDGELQGYVRKIYLLPHEGTDPVCTKCQGAIKNSKVMGMKIIWGFRKANEKWEDGKILDPGNGSTYTSTLWLVDPDTLKVRGYLGPFYRSQVWKRAKS